MATGSTSCFTNYDPQAGQGRPHMYGDAHHQDVLSTRIESGTGTRLDSPSTSLLYNLSLLKDKLHQVQSLVGMYISPNHSQNTDESTAIAKANMGTLLQEIIITASSMLFSCQQISIGATPSKTSITHESLLIDKLPYDGLSQPNHDHDHGETLDWFGENYSNTSCYTSMNNSQVSPILVDNSQKLSLKNNYDIIEMDAADLLAKYTHYCHICGKGFKRDANLRMHMRAHGDEYKSSAALSNPTKNNGGGYGNELARKYSCPQEGCRWNQKHAKFQPLKSMICVKNHYKRCHCPKMYVCKRCNRKQFSVLSDLRTHEKHCGDLKWQCSCGTTFSRKDKLMGHVALFVGHLPAVNSFTAMSRRNVKIRLDDR